MKSKWFIGIIILITSLLVVNLPSSFFAQAQDIERNSEGIADFYLYNELLMLANQGQQTPLLKLETNALSTKEEITITNSEIESIEGLQLLNLGNLKRLNLSSNKIKNVTAQMLSGLTSLEELNLSFNEITEIDVSNLQNLNVLLLENNKLAEIDVSNIVYNGVNGSGYVNLKNNDLMNLSDIVLPSEQEDAILVDLNNNFLTNEAPSLYTQTHELQLLSQGIKQSSNLLEGSILQVYETDYFDSFNLKIYDEQENFVAQVEEGQSILLTPNNYVFYYYNVDTPLYSSTTLLPREFEPVNFIISLQMPSIEVRVNSEVVESKPTYKEAVTLIFSAYNVDAQTYYSINNGIWTQGSELLLTTNGQYNIRTRTSLNEMNSDIFQITLSINNSWQNTQNVIRAVISLTVIIIILLGGYIYYKKKAIV